MLSAIHTRLWASSLNARSSLVTMHRLGQVYISRLSSAGVSLPKAYRGTAHTIRSLCFSTSYLRTLPARYGTSVRVRTQSLPPAKLRVKSCALQNNETLISLDCWPW